MGIASKRHSSAFTIVELIIVIVVIGIIAGITVMSYAAITTDAAKQSLQTDLQGAASQLTRYKADNGGYPSTLDATDIASTSTTAFDYMYLPVTGGYCLSASAGDMSFHMSDSDAEPREGACSTDAQNDSYDAAIRVDFAEISKRIQAFYSVNNRYPLNNDSELTTALKGYQVHKDAYETAAPLDRNLTYCYAPGASGNFALGALSKSGKTWVSVNNAAPFEYGDGYFVGSGSSAWCSALDAGTFPNSYNGYVPPSWRAWVG